MVPTNFHLEDGLGGENVMAILPTPEGFIWIATEAGLDRLDPQIVNYSTKDGLADNRFFDLCATPDALWREMQWGGLGRFDGKEFTTVLPGLYARKLYRTPDGVLWIGSNKGALRYDGTRLLPGELLPNRWVMAIASDAGGGMWFGDAWAGGGLVRAQTNVQGNFTTKTFTREDGLAHNEVSSILCASSGETWVGTAGGVSRFSGDKIKSYEASDGLPSNGVRALYQAKDGGIWLGTGRGVARYDGHSFSNITAACGMPAYRICSIYQTRDGLMWFGTDGRGVCVFDGKAFSMLDTRDGLAGNSILAQSAISRVTYSQSGILRHEKSRHDSAHRERTDHVVEVEPCQEGDGPLGPALGDHSPGRRRAGEHCHCRPVEDHPSKGRPLA